MKKRISILLITCLMMVTLGVFGSPLYAAEKVLKTSLDAADAGQDTFNPFTTNSTNNIYYLIYDRLVEMGADGVIYPHLLSSWKVSDDGMKITFSLRNDVTFHDGSELNADVLKWFLENIAKGKSKYKIGRAHV